MNYDKIQEEEIESLMEYEVEELESILENPQDIEVGHGIARDELIEEEIRLIKEAIRRKELKEEHLRES